MGMEAWLARWMDAGNVFGSAATFRRCLPEKVAYVVLNLADMALTLFAMSGGFWEHNPLMRYLVTMPVMLVTIKVLLPVFIAWLSPGKLLLPAIGLLCAVLAWNLKEVLLYWL